MHSTCALSFLWTCLWLSLHPPFSFAAFTTYFLSNFSSSIISTSTFCTPCHLLPSALRSTWRLHWPLRDGWRSANQSLIGIFSISFLLQALLLIGSSTFQKHESNDVHLAESGNVCDTRSCRFHLPQHPQIHGEWGEGDGQYYANWHSRDEAPSHLHAILHHQPNFPSHSNDRIGAHGSTHIYEPGYLQR